MKPFATVTKVCREMEQFQERHSLGIADLTRRPLPGDVHRVLASLRTHRYIRQDSETRKYQLGIASMRIGITAFERNRLREKGQPTPIQLSKRLGVTTHLGLLDGQGLELSLIDRISGPAAGMLQVTSG